jgi:hypothetical protein
MKITKSSISYENYIKHGLQSISSSLSVKAYKRAGSNVLLKMTFDKTKDYLIKILWKDEPIMQFVIERSFWHQSNTNDKDRQWMRVHADEKLNVIRTAVAKGKERRDLEKKKCQTKD